MAKTTTAKTTTTKVVDNSNNNATEDKIQALFSMLEKIQKENEELKSKIEQVNNDEKKIENQQAQTSSSVDNNYTNRLLETLVNNKMNQEVTIVHGTQMFGGLTTCMVLGNMEVVLTNLGEYKTLTWQQFEEMVGKYRGFIEAGIIKITPAQRDLCEKYQIQCYEDGDYGNVITTDILKRLPDMSESELVKCYQGLSENDQKVVLNYWLGQCYARPEEKDKRFYNRYKLELLNKLSNSQIFSNMIADINADEQRARTQ